MALCNVLTQAHKFCALEAHGTNRHSMHLYSTFGISASASIKHKRCRWSRYYASSVFLLPTDNRLRPHPAGNEVKV